MAHNDVYVSSAYNDPMTSIPHLLPLEHLATIAISYKFPAEKIVYVADQTEKCTKNEKFILCTILY